MTVFVGFTINTLGTLLIAYTAIKVHVRVLRQHAIDTQVLKEIKRERVIGIIGGVLIIIGYFLQLPSFL